MTSLRRWLAVAVVAATFSVLPAEDKKPAAPADDGFKPMFNGKNLDGWVNVNCHPDTFFVKGEEVITTGTPTGFLRTDKQYENFVLEMDWMHVNTKEVGNSGLFVWGDPLPAVGSPYTRGIEVQVLVNLEYKDKKTGAVTATSHGDLFSIWGAKCLPDRPHPNGSERCLPSENRAKGGGEWNHYKVTANDGVIKLEVNGKEVSGVSKCSPRKGYLALESEGAECHFKNLRIKELPSTNPKPEECATVAAGHVSLFNGIDLTGWKADKDAWKVAGGAVRTGAKQKPLTSTSDYTDCELLFDWKVPAKAVNVSDTRIGGLVVRCSGKGVQSARFSSPTDVIPGDRVESNAVKLGAWNRTIIRRVGKMTTVTVNGEKVSEHTFDAVPSSGPIQLRADGVEDVDLQIMNVFVRELKEEKK